MFCAGPGGQDGNDQAPSRVPLTPHWVGWVERVSRWQPRLDAIGVLIATLLSPTLSAPASYPIAMG